MRTHMEKKESKTKSKRKPQATAVKHSLTNPFQLHWPSVEEDVLKEVLELIKSSFDGVKLHKPARKLTRNERMSRKRSNAAAKVNAVVKRPKLAENDKNSKIDIETESTSANATPDNSMTRLVNDVMEVVDSSQMNQFVVGINAVTRTLERNELRAGLICLTAQPSMVTQHILMLSATRNCPIMALPNLTSTLGPLLGIRSALAVGIKKLSSQDDHDYFKDLVSFVADKAPSVSLPWLSRTHPVDNEHTYLPLTIKTLKPKN